MASQALYRKWRSQTFDELVGQQHVTQTLLNALKLGRIGHAYLFTGPRGTGKTSTARLLAKAVNCLVDDLIQRPCNQCTVCRAINEGRLLDLIEIDAASNTGVDDIRDLRDKVGFRPSEAKYKFYVVDECHMLSNSAFNALLKTLEEPPPHVIFVLATTEPEKIPATITSRCQRFDFKRISVEKVAEHLGHIVKEEGLSADATALTYIAKQGGGSMRDAISLLDQLTAYGGEVITLELVRNVLGAVTSQIVVELVDALINEDVAGGLDIINRVVSDGVDSRQFAREIVEYLRAVMLVKLAGGGVFLNLPEETLKIMRAQASRANIGKLVKATTLFNKSLTDLKSGLLAIPQLPLELAFVEVVTSVAMVAAVATESVASAPRMVAPPLKVKEEPMSTEVATSAQFSLEFVRSHFEQAINHIEKKNKLMAEVLRNNAILQKVVDNRIYFTTEASFKARFEQPKPQAVLDEAFSMAMERTVTVRFLAGDLGAESKRNESSKVMVETALKELGGVVH